MAGLKKVSDYHYDSVNWKGSQPINRNQSQLLRVKQCGISMLDGVPAACGLAMTSAHTYQKPSFTSELRTRGIR